MVGRSSGTFIQANREREQVVKACSRSVESTIRSELHVPSGHRIWPSRSRNHLVRVRSAGCRICRRWSRFGKYDLTVCVAHTRLRVDSMMLLRLMLLMMGPLTIYPPNLEVIWREIVHHSEWLRLKLSILVSVSGCRRCHRRAGRPRDSNLAGVMSRSGQARGRWWYPVSSGPKWSMICREVPFV